MRRTGHLEDVPGYLQKSEEFVGTRSSLEPGLNFCKGMFEWYSGNPNNALKLFNKVNKYNNDIGRYFTKLFLRLGETMSGARDQSTT